MASTSGKGKELEKKNEEDEDNGRNKSENKNMHVKLENELIKSLKNSKEWEEVKPQWSVTAEEIEEMPMKTYDFDYVLKNHLLDEEIAWDDDVWGLQYIIKIPKTSHAEEAKNNKDSAN